MVFCSSLFVFSCYRSGAASGYNQILSPIYPGRKQASYLSFALTITIAITTLLGVLLSLFYEEFVSLASYFKLDAEF